MFGSVIVPCVYSMQLYGGYYFFEEFLRKELLLLLNTGGLREHWRAVNPIDKRTGEAVASGSCRSDLRRHGPHRPKQRLPDLQESQNQGAALTP